MSTLAATERLLSQLASALGRRSATQELRWMQELDSSVPALQKMVERRIQGEPLQYILGEHTLFVRLPSYKFIS